VTVRPLPAGTSLIVPPPLDAAKFCCMAVIEGPEITIWIVATMDGAFTALLATLSPFQARFKATAPTPVAGVFVPLAPHPAKMQIMVDSTMAIK
jgi:hypothetical protein